MVRKGRGVLTHDISNCGEWDESGGTRQYQRNTNWLLWNHIQGAALKPGDFFFSINGPDGNRKLRDSDISRLVKSCVRKLGLSDAYFSSKSLRIAMLSIICQLGEAEVRRIGHWSSNAFEFYKRMIGNVPCAGDLTGVSANFVARTLPFDGQRAFEAGMKEAGDMDEALRLRFDIMLSDVDERANFTRKFHRDLVSQGTVAPELAAQVCG